MFSRDRFTQDCLDAVADGQQALREVMVRAVSDGAAVVSELGEPVHAGINPLYRSPRLTILNFVWAPDMILMPHNHQMFAVIGVYAGREDNIFWRRKDQTIEAASARSLGAGEVAALGQETIHSVLNPLGKMSCALHVYGGDFFAPERPRSEWDHETLGERPWDVERVRRLFSEAEERFECMRRREIH